eukprot:10013772-Karenia_brevis.AAC.1
MHPVPAPPPRIGFCKGFKYIFKFPAPPASCIGSNEVIYAPRSGFRLPVFVFAKVPGSPASCIGSNKAIYAPRSGPAS